MELICCHFLGVAGLTSHIVKIIEVHVLMIVGVRLNLEIVLEILGWTAVLMRAVGERLRVVRNHFGLDWILLIIVFGWTFIWNIFLSLSLSLSFAFLAIANNRNDNNNEKNTTNNSWNNNGNWEFALVSSSA